jgi:hypothetical protein
MICFQQRRQWKTQTDTMLTAHLNSIALVAVMGNIGVA